MIYKGMSLRLARALNWRRVQPGYRWLKGTLLATAVGTCLGCLTPVTHRLDAIHAELQWTRQEMADVNARLSETNRRLENIEGLLKRFPLLKPASELPEASEP